MLIIKNIKPREFSSPNIRSESVLQMTARNNFELVSIDFSDPTLMTRKGKKHTKTWF